VCAVSSKSPLPQSTPLMSVALNVGAGGEQAARSSAKRKKENRFRKQGENIILILEKYDWDHGSD
jgi:hypothetical protein